MASKHALQIMRSARAGDAASQYQLGMIHLTGGEGFAANPKVAYSWLNRAAKQGFAPAWKVIGDHLLPEHAAGDSDIHRWYRLAAEAGSSSAALQVGKSLLAAAVDDAGTQAATWLRQAADAGDSEACLELGRMLLAEKNGNETRYDALGLLETAWCKGQREAARLLADYFWGARKPEAANLWYGRYAEPANAEVHYRRGVLCALLGQPGGDFLHQAATAGHLLACEELGIAFAEGSVSSRGLRRNFKQAVRWLEVAAHEGSPRAAYLLAMVLQHPTSLQRNVCRSRYWMFRAARNGHPEACFNAGVALIRELSAGRKPNPAEIGGDDVDVSAVRFLIRAEQQGLAKATPYLRRLASRADPPKGEALMQWKSISNYLQETDPVLAVRLQLAMTMGLTARELVAFDPLFADRGECFVVDLTAWRASYRRRIVLIESDEQRCALQQVKRVLIQERGEAKSAISETAAISRYRWLRRVCRKVGATFVESAIFPRSGILSTLDP